MKVSPGKSIKCHDLIDADIDDPEEINEEDENEIQIAESSTECVLKNDEIQCSSSNSNQPGKMPVDIFQNNMSEGTWVVVNYGKKTPKLYFGKIVKVIRKGYMYEGSFTRPKKSTLPKLHVFPDVIDFCEFLIEDVVRIVSPPQYLRRGILKFDVGLDEIVKTMM